MRAGAPCIEEGRICIDKQRHQILEVLGLTSQIIGLPISPRRMEQDALNAHGNNLDAEIMLLLLLAASATIVRVCTVLLAGTHAQKNGVTLMID